MLYDREAYNTFCEPRLQIDLLFTYLRIERNMSKEVKIKISEMLLFTIYIPFKHDPQKNVIDYLGHSSTS